MNWGEKITEHEHFGGLFEVDGCLLMGYLGSGWRGLRRGPNELSGAWNAWGPIRTALARILAILPTRGFELS